MGLMFFGGSPPRLTPKAKGRHAGLMGLLGEASLAETSLAETLPLLRCPAPGRPSSARHGESNACPAEVCGCPGVLVLQRVSTMHLPNQHGARARSCSNFMARQGSSRSRTACPIALASGGAVSSAGQRCPGPRDCHSQSFLLAPGSPPQESSGRFSHGVIICSQPPGLLFGFQA